MLYILIATFIIIACVIWNIILRFRDPPGPIGIPFTGLFPIVLIKSLCWYGNDNLYFQKMRRKYGEMWSFRINAQRYVVLSSPELMIEAFSKEGLAFSGRPMTRLHSYITSRRGVLTSDGDIWRFFRKLLIKAMHAVSCTSRNYEDILERNAEKLFVHLNQAKMSEDTSSMFHSLSLVIILEIIFGMEFSLDDDLVTLYIENMSLITNSNVVLHDELFFLTDVPMLRSFVPHTVRLKNAIDCNKNILKTLWDNVCQRDTHLKTSECIAEYFLEELRSQQPDPLLNDHNCIQNYFDLVNAGSDTISSTLAWSCLLLSKHTDVQEKLRRQILDFSSERNVELIHYKDRMSVGLLCSFIDEVHRFCDIVPRVMHRPMTKVSFHGYELQDTDIVLGDTFSCNRDPNLWLQPDKFQFDRFIDPGNGRYRKFAQTFMPFGVGKRSCIGESIGRAEVFVVLVNLIKRYKVIASKNTADNVDKIMDGGGGLLHMPLRHSVIFAQQEDV